MSSSCSHPMSTIVDGPRTWRGAAGVELNPAELVACGANRSIRCASHQCVIRSKAQIQSLTVALVEGEDKRSVSGTPPRPISIAHVQFIGLVTAWELLKLSEPGRLQRCWKREQDEVDSYDV